MKIKWTTAFLTVENDLGDNLFMTFLINLGIYTIIDCLLLCWGLPQPYKKIIFITLTIIQFALIVFMIYSELKKNKKIEIKENKDKLEKVNQEILGLNKAKINMNEQLFRANINFKEVPNLANINEISVLEDKIKDIDTSLARTIHVRDFINSNP
jgi:hypothetical protein